MPSIPWVYVEAARFLGATLASGAVVGLIVAVVRMVRRG